MPKFAKGYNQPVDADVAQFFSELNEFSGVIKNAEAHTDIGVIKTNNV